MAGIQDFQEFYDDFNGAVATLPTSADPATPWLVDDTSVTGTPTYTKGTSVATMTLNNDNAIVNVCLHFNDALDFDIDDIQTVEMRVRIGAATFTSGSILTFGVGSARADDPDTITASAFFKMVGATSTTLVLVESDDGTHEVAATSTGKTLGTTFKRFVIDFTGGKSNVKFYIDGERVNASQTFNMSAYSSGLQPIVQVQKAANTNADSVVVDYIKITSKRG
jgi:hypothetical protein